MARTKTEENQAAEGPKIPKKKNSVNYLQFVEKNLNKKSLEEKFQTKIQTAISGTESTVKTDTGENNKPKIHFGSIVSDGEENKAGTDTANGQRNPAEELTLSTGAGRTVRPLVRSPTGYTQRQIKVQNRKKKTETDSEEEDDFDDEEIPETTGRQTFETSERIGRYVPIQTNPEDDAPQLHTNGEIPGENNKL